MSAPPGNTAASILHRAGRGWLPLALLGSLALPARIGATPPPDQVVVRPSGAAVTLRWQATTLDPAARFRLLRGTPGAPLRLVAELPATQGNSRYRVVDRESSLTDQVYQLRVVGTDGVERVLRTVACERHRTCVPAPPAGSATPAPVALLPLRSPLAEPDSARLPHLATRSNAIAGLLPEPLEPPPWSGFAVPS